MSWFPDKESGYLWCGPGLRYPFTRATFLEDARWGEMPTYSLIDSDGELLAFGQYYEKSGRCHLARLAVSPLARGKGVGKVLISKLIQVGMHNLNVSESSLFVVKNNIPALRCYTTLGFEAANSPDNHNHYDDIQFMVAKSA
ncbi:GNAT family N-acetyltransferase [Amphritea balenae]|uniref:GNAT family N-acetyltransferase n=1 Tax=Amphritea balenae TaxID=452629 RepID=A0A3P1SUK1_9GAMM|nr:GNAT family N-acetyltransferase [Amphritea balenae]RRD00236.1 GNAT family N-acetyltransferase [Amphritea balenae]